MKRCEVNSLSENNRWEIGTHELQNLRRKFDEKKIEREIFEKRRAMIVDFISAISDRIDSDGVIVEFYVPIA